MNGTSGRAVLLTLYLLLSCNPEKSEHKSAPSEKKPKEFYIVPGEDESIEQNLIKKGKVLISYSDCYDCHREESKAKGPSFSDIAKRYPMRKEYLDLLAQKVINGGSGNWGYPVMSPHPNLKLEDARAMVAFILSSEVP